MFSDRIDHMDMQEFSEHKELPPITNPSLILLLGPSGAGKSEVIERLSRLDERITPNNIYTDRAPRYDDFGRICVTPEEITNMNNNGEFLVCEEAYGFRYGTLKNEVVEALKDGKIPIQDYPEALVGKFREKMEDIHAIYILPPSIGTLHQRLDKAGRDSTGSRFEVGRAELLDLKKRHFDTDNIDNVVINRDVDKAAAETLELIYKKVCRS